LWENFKRMPRLLKFLTAHALAMSVSFIFSVIPVVSFGIGYKSVSYAEWWSSGVGIFASIMGILLPTAGYLFLKRDRYARIVYVGSMVFISLFQFARVGLNYHSIISFILILPLIGLISAYLFLSKSVKLYFVSTDPI
jgi:hypothetical protein